MNPKEEAEKKWQRQMILIGRELRWNGNHGDVEMGMKAVSDYKSALREKIEERVHDSQVDLVSWRAFNQCLELLDTVKPKEL